MSELVGTAMAPASMSTLSTSSQDEEDDEFDDNSEEFSFHRFSVLHFQGNATHSHITQRLRQPLLPHDDEGDALVRGWTRELSKGFSCVSKTHFQFFLGFSRHVLLCGGSYCVSWRTFLNQNLRTQHLKRPGKLRIIFLISETGG